MRSESFGQQGKLTPVDKFGIWLSHKAVSRWVPSFRDKAVGDFGCGFEARALYGLLDQVREAHLADVSLSAELKRHPHVRAYEGFLPDTLARIDSETLDVVLCLSVIEHLDKPLEALSEIRRVLKPGGRALINVPSWMGKRALEFSAFKLGLSPAAEMDDHRTYYDVRDLWPLLIKAGFKPSQVRCFTHKFGLNTFAVCDKS